MVAYSFQKRFVDPILSRRKAQTIRPERKRHARPGEEVQLYVGMRTRHCRLIGRATCTGVERVELAFFEDRRHGFVRLRDTYRETTPDEFAQADGFTSWAQLREFWRLHYFPETIDWSQGGIVFEGILVSWDAKTFRPAPSFLDVAA